MVVEKRSIMKATLIYNTGQKTKNELVSEFVVRLREFNRIFDDLKSYKKGELPQNFLVVGVRGMGKTMLLQKIKYSILDNSNLSKYLVPISFSEELYNVNDLIDFWHHIAELLESTNPEFLGLVNDIENEITKNKEREIFKILLVRLKKEKKHLALLIDNFDDLITKLNPNEKQRLREILISNEEFRFIAATSSVLEETFKYEEPFYEFFKYIKLTELNKEDTITLLKNLGEIYIENERIDQILKKEAFRIESLRRLSGGNPRTIVLLYEILQGEKSGDTLHYLNEILDRNVTALYKSRMDKLKPQQQKIINAVALSWDAVSVKEISNKVRISSKQISSQLNQLVESNFIEKIETSTKNNFYHIKERFFNIWYLMRFSNQKNKDKVKWLIKFFDIWCTQDDLRKKLTSIVCDIVDQKYNKHGTELMLEALSETKNCNEHLKKDIDAILEYAKSTTEKIKVKPILKRISEGDEKAWSDLSRITSRDTVINYIALARKEKNKGNLHKSITYYLEASKLGNYSAEHQLGHLYFKINDIANGKLFFEKAISNTKGRKPFACFASELKQAELYEDAIEYYLLDYKKGNKRSLLEAAELLYTELSEFEIAKKHYLELLELPEDIENERCAHRLGHIYQEEGNYKKSIEYFELAKSYEEISIHPCELMCYYAFNKKKELSLEQAITYNKNENSTNSNHVLATMYLWNDMTAESIDLIPEFLYDDFFLEEDMHWAIDYLILLVAKGNLHIVDNIFTTKNVLKDKLKPVYYALMILLQKKYPNEHKKMGSELKETVEEVLERIKEYTEKYKTVANT